MSVSIQFDKSKEPRSKVELHVHLDGAVRLSTVWELAQKKGIPLEAKSLDELIDLSHVKRPSTLTEFLKPFSIFTPVIVGDADAIERIAFEFCEDAAGQGVLYSEVRFCPHLMCTGYGCPPAADDTPITPRDVVECVCRGLNRGAAQFNITVRSILCCFRANPEWSKEIVDMCVEFKKHGVVGIDVAGDESQSMADPQIVEAFQRAAAVGVHRTAHAGEAGPAKNVHMAINEMHAERIGHGYHVLDEEDVYAQCIEKDVHFETCPYSSVLTGSVPLSEDKHPIIKFAEDNINFSISRDDPTLVQKSLDLEYDFLRGMGLKEAHFARANFNAARSCFLPDAEKQLLLQKLLEVYGACAQTPASRSNSCSDFNIPA